MFSNVSINLCNSNHQNRKTWSWFKWLWVRICFSYTLNFSSFYLWLVFFIIIQSFTRWLFISCKLCSLGINFPCILFIFAIILTYIFGHFLCSSFFLLLFPVSRLLCCLFFNALKTQIKPAYRERLKVSYTNYLFLKVFEFLTLFLFVF